MLYGGGERPDTRRPQGGGGVREDAPGEGVSPSDGGLRPWADEAQGKGAGHGGFCRRRDTHSGFHNGSGGRGGRTQCRRDGGGGCGPVRAQPAPPAAGACGTGEP